MLGIDRADLCCEKAEKKPCPCCVSLLHRLGNVVLAIHGNRLKRKMLVVETREALSVWHENGQNMPAAPSLVSTVNAASATVILFENDPRGHQDALAG